MIQKAFYTLTALTLFAFSLLFTKNAYAAPGYDAECLARFTKTCCNKVFTDYPAGSLPKDVRLGKLAACVADEKDRTKSKPKAK